MCKVHVLKFDTVDTTMRIADEFTQFDEFAGFICLDSKFSADSAGKAIAFQALEQTMGRG